MKRWLVKLFKFVAVFIAVYMLIVGLAVWRVATKPIASTTLTPYIETAVESLFPKTKASIARTRIAWDNADYSLAIQGEQAVLRDEAGGIIAEIPVIEFKLNVLGYFKGQFLPAEMEIENPQIWLVRKADGTVWFGGMATGGGERDPNAVSIWEGIKHFVRGLTRVGPLHDLSVRNAVLSVHDEETAQDWAINIPEVALKKGWKSLKGRAKIEVFQKDHSTLLEAQYAFDRLSSQHKVSVEFKNINPSVLGALSPKTAERLYVDMPLTGGFAFVTDEDINIVSINGRVEGGEGYVNAPLFWDKKRPFKSARLEGSYDRETGRLAIPLADLDFDGATKLTMKVDGRKPPVPKVTSDQQPADMAFTATIRLADLPMDRYADVWPKPIITNASEWIVANLSKGKFPQGDVTLKGSFAWNDLGNMVLASAEGHIAASNATVAYIEGMPKVEGVNAEATFDLDHMTVNVFSGGIGALKVVPFTVEMTDFQKNVQNITLPVKLKGPVRDVIRLMDNPPFGYAKAVGLSADNTDGALEGTLELRFPLLKSLLMKDVNIKAQAQLTNFSAQKIIPGIDITQSNLSLDLNKESYALKGPASLNKVPVHLMWASRFSAPDKDSTEPKNKANISGQITGEQWTQLGVDLTGKLKGPSIVNLEYAEFASGPAKIAADIDFRQAEIQFDELGWKKLAGIAAALKFEAEMEEGKNIHVKTIILQGAGLNAKGSAELDRATQRLLQLDLTPLVLGRTNANLRFRQTADDKGELSFSAEGESFDVSGLTGGKDPARSDPRPKAYSLKLGKLHTSENGFISDITAKAKRDAQGWSEIELHGMADGGHPLDISLAAKNGKRVFSMICDDFGKALKGMGFTDTVKDGPIEIKGESAPDNPRLIEGTVKIGRFVVSGLPVLARLLSAASPFGLIDFVTGNASFDHLEGQFRWQDDTVDLIKVRAAGSVFGLNIDGRVDLNSGHANLKGTMVPFSLFNRIINVIPLLGDVITGGEGGGVLAVAYSVEGKLNDPSIGVNPVSLLTPGFLRNLFFDTSIPPPMTESKPETKDGKKQEPETNTAEPTAQP